MAETVESQVYPVAARLAAWDSGVVSGTETFRGELTVTIPREQLARVAGFLRHEPELEFDFLSDLTATDHFPLEPRFAVVYHMLSLGHRHTLRLRTWTPGLNPAVPSVTTIWPTANWHEREVFDLFGIRFEGHPDLTRILLPLDWEGNPLRKDYPTEGHR
ncbi:MAG TPA: NADH-quinone oxidoreductase subunit C [Candidatus Acidoferrales bacterium]|nr:NADH-quinone oxidoreductase subunit C [Candidatus Acidoferrales bacterium]